LTHHTAAAEAGRVRLEGAWRSPTLVADIDLDSPLVPVVSDPRYRRARLLVWKHGRPLGEIDVPMDGGRLEPAELHAAVRAGLGARVDRHRAAGGIDGTGGPGGGVDAEQRALPRQTAREEAGSRQVPVTVVVPTRDRTESLLRCLRSIDRQDYADFDVVVVDSHPSDDATRRAVEAPGPWRFELRYLRTEHPGSALARSVAIPGAQGEIVAFADDDVEVDRKWISALAEAFDSDEVACVTGLILPAELDTEAQLLLEQYGGFARGFEPQRYRMTDRRDALFPFAAGRFGSGANMAFRTSWLRRRGGFDVATGAGTVARGGEDLLAFLDVILDHQTLVYQPAAVVRHHHRRELSGLQRQAFGYGVGLGAYLTAAIWARPSLLPTVVSRGAMGARYFLQSTSAKNRGKAEDFPAGLTWRERAGIVAGPFAYALNRYRSRDVRTEVRAMGLPVR
jgi:hypothetical protein